MNVAEAAVLGLLVAGCSVAPARRAPLEPRADRESRGGAPGGDALAAHLQSRLPGERSLTLLRVVTWASRTPGACTADFAAGPASTAIDLAYETREEQRSLRGAELEALATSGWTLAYRAPAGI